MTLSDTEAIERLSRDLRTPGTPEHAAGQALVGRLSAGLLAGHGPARRLLDELLDPETRTHFYYHSAGIWEDLVRVGAGLPVMDEVISLTRTHAHALTGTHALTPFRSLVEFTQPFTAGLWDLLTDAGLTLPTDWIRREVMEGCAMYIREVMLEEQRAVWEREDASRQPGDEHPYE